MLLTFANVDLIGFGSLRADELRSFYSCHVATTPLALVGSVDDSLLRLGDVRSSTAPLAASAAPLAFPGLRTRGPRPTQWPGVLPPSITPSLCRQAKVEAEAKPEEKAAEEAPAATDEAKVRIC